MSLIGSVGRKRWRARLAMSLIYGVLILGAITTLYPFLLMISTGTKSTADQNDTRLVAGYFRTDAELLTKYVNDKYAEDKNDIASTRIGAGADAETVAKYGAFLMQLDPLRWAAGFRLPSTQVVSKLNGVYRAFLRTKFATIEDLNRAYVEENVAFQTVMAPPELFDRKTWKPNSGRKWADWLEFKKTLPAEFRVPIRTAYMYQKFIGSKYKMQWSAVPDLTKGSAKTFNELQILPGPDFDEFQTKSLPARFRDASVESEWLRFSGKAEMPVASMEASFVASHEGELRREFATRNYAYVLDYILLHGRAVANTALFCLLAIVTQLTVNPLAAYALSRYPIRATSKILLFLLATMAFPAEVAMIPSFLLLKDLGLLNTFAALVLPGAASGYMIFLLKGFFDSLPQELYESAQIDGAKETTMMSRIAFPMSRAVLGYLALLAFMGAYGSFIYAFLIAQDQKMWTMMVWVYQLQQTAPKCVMMAALSIAALPTLVVFLFAQKFIMQGIVLPGEK